MQLIHSISQLRQRLTSEPSIAFVPTMGNLHEGHLSLVQIAQSRAACVVVSIFVNRLQFEPGADFERYPRTLKEDCAKLQAHNLDIVFAPNEQEIYPVPQQTIIQPSDIANTLEGEHRPGHFAGVATVVLKLLNIVQPCIAVFGKKDYQQLAIVHEMVQQLNLPIEIIGGDIVRANDGLALSSRNSYLSSRERTEATRLNQQLRKIISAIDLGQRNYEGMESAAAHDLQAHGWNVDYIAIRNQYKLTLPSQASKELIILAAARLGKTRLIDNLETEIA